MVLDMAFMDLMDMSDFMAFRTQTFSETPKAPGLPAAARSSRRRPVLPPPPCRILLSCPASHRFFDMRTDWACKRTNSAYSEFALQSQHVVHNKHALWSWGVVGKSGLWVNWQLCVACYSRTIACDHCSYTWVPQPPFQPRPPITPLVQPSRRPLPHGPA